MYSTCDIFYIIILKLFLFLLVSGEVIKFNDGEIIYEYDDQINHLGGGRYGNTIKGIRKERNLTKAVAFKENWINETNYLVLESEFYEKMGSHDSIPKFYGYFPATDIFRAVLVNEIFGKDLCHLQETHKRFSIVTVMKIGLHLLNVLEDMHNKGIIYNDLHCGNIAVGLKNDSRIYIYDFGLSFMYNQDQPILASYSGGNEDARRRDLSQLVDLLEEFALYDVLPIYNDFKLHKATFPDFAYYKQFFKQFSTIARYPIIEKPNYEELKNILQTELERHENEPNFDKFDWQIRQSI